MEVIMRHVILPALLLSLAGTASVAQQPHFGAALDMLAPVGSLRSTTLPPYMATSGDRVPAQESGYDLGWGGQFTISFPVDQNLALRLNLSGHSMDGSDTAPGFPKIYLRHRTFSLGGDMQIFTQSAYRHKGLYFLAGLSADFESFDRSFDNLNNYDYEWNSYQDVDVSRKSRLGGTLGIGHTFGGDAGLRFNLEAAFHKTLSKTDDVGLYPNADFLRMSFGCIF
jgi:hypothetical protein